LWAAALLCSQHAAANTFTSTPHQPGAVLAQPTLQQQHKHEAELECLRCFVKGLIKLQVVAAFMQCAEGLACPAIACVNVQEQHEAELEFLGCFKTVIVGIRYYTGRVGVNEVNICTCCLSLRSM
jgi:hypothetical protein